MSSLFGGSTPQIQFSPRGFDNPTGFSVSGRGDVTQSPALAANIGGLQSTFGQQASAFGGLAQTVQPGFSQFRQAGLADIQNQFQSNLSSLKQNLAQRGIAGSSFANDQISNAYATNAQTQADFEAKSYLEELNAQYQLIQAQYQAQQGQYQSFISQGNFETQVAAQLTAQNNQIGAQVAIANANLQAQAAQGQGALLGLGTAFLGKWASTGFAGPGGATLGSLFSGAAVLA